MSVRVCTIVSALVASFCLCANAQAVPEPQPPSFPAVVGFAKENGLTLEQASETLKLQASASMAVSPLRDEMPDWLSGTWLGVDGTQYIGVVDGEVADSYVTRLLRKNGFGGKVAVVRQTRSLKELMADGRIALSVAIDTQELGRASTALDEKSNTQRLKISQEAPAVARIELNEGLERSNLDLPVERVPEEQLENAPAVCAGAACDRPIRGGVKLAPQGAQSTCSAGYFARSPNYIYLITAGHCGRNVWMAHDPTHSPYWERLGSTVSTSLFQNQPYDHQAIRIESSSYWYSTGQRGWFQNWSGNLPQGDLRPYYIASQPQVGAWICRFGMTSYSSCGAIFTASVNATFIGGLTYWDMFGTLACANPGDSGGPALDGYDAGLKGTLTASNVGLPCSAPATSQTGESYYSKAVVQMSQMGLSVIY